MREVFLYKSRKNPRPHINKIARGVKTAAIDLLIEIAARGGVVLDYLILEERKNNDVLKEKIKKLREILENVERSL